jgi:hypothetical protein
LVARAGIATLLLLCLAPAGRVAAAPARAPAAAAQAAGPAVDEAQAHFRRAVDLYRDGDMAGALVEFSRAHDLVPSYKILYNLGQVSYELRDYAAAVRYYRAYLTEGGADVPPDRRREVEADLPRLETRVGRLDVRAAQPGATVLVDDVPAGTTPLAGPITTNVGRRKVELVSPAGDRQSRLVPIAGGETVVVSFAAPPAVPPVAAPRAPAPPLLAQAPAAPPPPPASHARRGPWVAWTLTALVGGAAATAGVLAVGASRDLHNDLEAYVAMPETVSAAQSKARRYALAADGLAAGTALLAALSLYVTFGSSSPESRPAP